MVLTQLYMANNCGKLLVLVNRSSKSAQRGVRNELRTLLQGWGDISWDAGPFVATACLKLRPQWLSDLYFMAGGLYLNCHSPNNTK